MIPSSGHFTVLERELRETIYKDLPLMGSVTECNAHRTLSAKACTVLPFGHVYGVGTIVYLSVHAIKLGVFAIIEKCAANTGWAMRISPRQARARRQVDTEGLRAVPIGLFLLACQTLGQARYGTRLHCSCLKRGLVKTPQPSQGLE